ncbi:hypothetical protein BUALT_Bualt01G0194500 [Buddleja alternifolia]|uniref:Phytocyanin domain-containing protein n=1 Tax=Buddleja alternifolia TaxID=168488 RepID=A0AAV6YEX3_9LAMI|nr:hypothetical protein BUALT_Bualt01G0194300 [Buddleja alternifolia]KAG8391503.1 hypothetical protein BUALT_Bualt01G0194500 [Buddleja alternifolia]
MAKALAFLVLLFISPAAYAVTYTVGGNSGWNTGVDYVSWASAQTFTTNDSLVFNFGPSHAVDEVRQANYQSCDGGNPISSSTSSPTTIALTAPGTRYFICPRSNHCSQAYAVTYTVGGNSGWNTGVNYVTWASGQTFTTADSLVFNFDATHAVDEVRQADYESCNGGNPITSSTSSPTTISLSTIPGIWYFICPRSNHCSRGQRLMINVTVASTPPGTPSPPATQAPPPPSGATSLLSGKNGLMIGFSLVLAAALI